MGPTLKACPCLFLLRPHSALLFASHHVQEPSVLRRGPEKTQEGLREDIKPEAWAWILVL